MLTDINTLTTMEFLSKTIPFEMMHNIREQIHRNFLNKGYSSILKYELIYLSTFVLTHEKEYAR